MKNILVTGGLGYIGSHTIVSLIENGYNPIILDNLSNSNLNILKKIEKITGKKPTFYQGDVRGLTVSYIFNTNTIDSVIHFAAFKSVSESINKPISYYDNNVSGLINLLRHMEINGVKNIIFSSSCTVYGEPDILPINEETPTKTAKTPYGHSKQICEDILKYSPFNVVALRYFNPIGAHESGLLYDNPNGVPENLIPYITGVLDGTYKHLKVFGDDYNTLDGTAIRDYINVNDLADAHVKALNIIDDVKYEVINVGSGDGYSVMEIINAFKLEGYDIPYKILPRRSGDIEKIYSDNTKAETIMDWFPQKTLGDSVKSIIKTIK